MQKAFVAMLSWLSGKKCIIAGVITTTSAFLVTQNVITAEAATYINSLSLLFFGSASLATGSIIYNK